MARVFVSYTHQEPDKDIAQEVAGALRENHEVFIDTSIPGGRTWDDLIERELQTADFLIPLLSARSLASPMVVAEISAAHQLNVGQGRPAIIPVRLDSSQLRYPMTAYVGRFQEISWDGPGDTERLKKEAIRA